MDSFYSKGLLTCIISIYFISAAASIASEQFCGNWQQGYVKVHEDIVNGILPPRFAVAVTPATGFSGT
jgi:hypothetical protein